MDVRTSSSFVEAGKQAARQQAKQNRAKQSKTDNAGRQPARVAHGGDNVKSDIVLHSSQTRAALLVVPFALHNRHFTQLFACTFL